MPNGDVGSLSQVTPKTKFGDRRSTSGIEGGNLSRSRIFAGRHSASDGHVRGVLGDGRSPLSSPNVVPDAVDLVEPVESPTEDFFGGEAQDRTSGGGTDEGLDFIWAEPLGGERVR